MKVRPFSKSDVCAVVRMRDVDRLRMLEGAVCMCWMCLILAAVGGWGLGGMDVSCLGVVDGDVVGVSWVRLCASGNSTVCTNGRGCVVLCLVYSVCCPVE